MFRTTATTKAFSKGRQKHTTNNNGSTSGKKSRANSNANGNVNVHCFALLFRFAQTIFFLLGITYTVVVLLPLAKQYHFILSTNTPSTTNAENSILSMSDALAQYWKTSSTSSQQSSNITTTITTNTSNSSISIPYNPHRIITLVHVGKAGGVSLRRLTAVFCKLFFRHPKYDATRALRIATCLAHHFPDPNAKLTHMTQHYFHMEEYTLSELEESTSFLVTLRNPVDRIVSTYRYSHPGNCNDSNRHKVWRPRGCEAWKHKNKTGLIQNDIHFKCFPTPAMEDFAQALMRPWRRSQFTAERQAMKDYFHEYTKNQTTNTTNTLTTIIRKPPSHLPDALVLTVEERRHCRYLAREMVQGHGTYGSAPHMLYNYAYYATRSIWKFPTKEVFGIRTEFEWHDTLQLDLLLGGNGNLKQDRDVSHGSEEYVPSPLSTEAYQKLCCVLEQEIAVYEDIVMRVVNLTPDDKQHAMNAVRQKCGITTSWTEWRTKCRRNLRRDLRALQPCLIVNETTYPSHKVGFDERLLD